MNCAEKRQIADSVAALQACSLRPFRSFTATVFLALALLSLPISRKARAEDKAEVKSHFYIEDHARVQVFTEYLDVEKDLNAMFTLKLRGVYSTMSGATPTGSPPTSQSRAATTAAPSGGSVSMPTISGASAPKTRGDNGVPTVHMQDVRRACHADLITRLDDHALDFGFVYSTENDYDSLTFSLTDTIAFNQKNTELVIGASGSKDDVSIYTHAFEWDKQTYDMIVGVNQLLGPETVLGVHFTYGLAEGYLADPYKSVELNGMLAKDTRPDYKQKCTGLLSLTQYFDRLNGSLEASYRVGDDTFGIMSHTGQLAWYQKIGKRLILSPMVRYCYQSAADFYDVVFTGNPKYYSSDYRLSKFGAISGGIQAVWKVTDRFTVDVAYERYDMSGLDGKTSSDAYPSAHICTVGLRLWF